MIEVIVYGLGNNYKLYNDVINRNFKVVGHSDINESLRDLYDDFVCKDELREQGKCILITCSDIEPVLNDLIENEKIEVGKIFVLDEFLYLNRLAEKSTIIANAQFGEDYVIYSLLGQKGISLENAKYVELGVFHPYRSSNTYFLNQAGATGILVDANPEIINFLKVCRKGVTVLNRAIYMEDNQQVDFYISSDKACSSLIENNIHLNKVDVVGKITIDTISVNTVMEMQRNTIVLSIDIEGYDEIALRSIDFDICKPEIICVEIGTPSKELIEYMRLNGYEFYFNNRINSIFNLVKNK